MRETISQQAHQTDTSARIVHINTPETICKQRYIANGCTEREFSMAINHPVEVNVSKLSLLAHEVIRNDNDIRSFEQKILKSLQEVAKN